VQHTRDRIEVHEELERATRPGRTRLVVVLAIAAAAVLVAGLVALGRVGGGDDARIVTGLAGRAGSAVTAVPTAVPTSIVAPALSAPPTAPAAPTAATPSTTAAPARAAAPTTLAPAPTTVAPVQPTTAAAVACRNSTDPACGPFQFDPQPGPDSPMTVFVEATPGTPRAGQEVVFRITLHDPDGVSYRTSAVIHGDTGISGTSVEPCAKYGVWHPPAPDPARATEVLEVRHTYAEAGTHMVTFSFEAGPFDCVDAVTGRGDRPYASSASVTLTLVVTP
jgi:hypothetical protein